MYVCILCMYVFYVCMYIQCHMHKCVLYIITYIHTWCFIIRHAYREPPWPSVHVLFVSNEMIAIAPTDWEHSDHIVRHMYVCMRMYHIVLSTSTKNVCQNVCMYVCMYVFMCFISTALTCYSYLYQPVFIIHCLIAMLMYVWEPCWYIYLYHNTYFHTTIYILLSLLGNIHSYLWVR